MRLGFDRANFDGLADLWNRVAPPMFAMSSEQIRLCTTDSPLFDWGASLIEIEDGVPTAFIAVKRSAASLFSGPDADTHHITALAFTSPIQAIDLMSYVKQLLRNRGAYSLRFGGDHQHVFPGCPTEWQTLKDFLVVEGFEEGPEQFDVESDIASFHAMPFLHALMEQGKLVYEVRQAQLEDIPHLLMFLDREFPGRWYFDTKRKVEREERSDFVHILCRLGEPQVLGFSITQDGSHRFPIAGAVWKQSLGPNWGTLGPIGIAKSLRGKGLGGALLAGSLDMLRRQGVQKCLIDWTTLVEFYGQYGFSPTRKYVSMTLPLD